MTETAATAATPTAATEALQAAKAQLDAAKAQIKELTAAQRAAEKEAAVTAMLGSVPEGYEVSGHNSATSYVVLKRVEVDPWLVLCQHGTQKAAASQAQARELATKRADWCDKCKAGAPAGEPAAGEKPAAARRTRKAADAK